MRKERAVMSRGRKTDEKVKAKAQAMLMTGEKVVYIAERLGLSESTVQNWKKQLDDNKELAKVRDKIITDRINEYLMTALECEGTALKIVQMKLDSAMIAEQNRSKLINNLIEMDAEADEGTMQRDIKNILPEALSDVVRCFGVMAEKVALMSGRATQNVNLSGSVGMKFEDF